MFWHQCLQEPVQPVLICTLDTVCLQDGAIRVWYWICWIINRVSLKRAAWWTSRHAETGIRFTDLRAIHEFYMVTNMDRTRRDIRSGNTIRALHRRSVHAFALFYFDPLLELRHKRQRDLQERKITWWFLVPVTVPEKSSVPIELRFSDCHDFTCSVPWNARNQ